MKIDVWHSKAITVQAMLSFLLVKGQHEALLETGRLRRTARCPLNNEKTQYPFEAPSKHLRSSFEPPSKHGRDITGDMWLSSRWHHASIRLYTGQPCQRLHLTLAAKSRHYQPHDRPYPSSR